MSEYKISCLDDDAAIGTAIRQILQKYYSVECYTDPSLCLSDASRKGCDLLITDIKMPKMNGVELISRFRKHFPVVPVVIMTGYANVALAKRGIEVGANDLLEKPLNRLNLLRSIDDLLVGYSILKTFEKEYRLTKMEFMTLQHILAGRSTKEMSFLYNRSTRTLESHRLRLMKKCRVTNIMGLLTKPGILKYIKYRQKTKELKPSSINYKEEAMR